MGSPSPAKLSKRTTVNRSLSGGDGWGMGFLLVFFPQDHHHHHAVDSDSPPPFKPPTINNTTILKRSSSTHLLAKAQTTVSICALVVFFTLLVFTLCNFEPNNTSHHYRRHLAQTHSSFQAKKGLTQLNSPALQRLGTLYTRGTKPMNDIVIAHVTDSHSTLSELKSFLRAFHRSGLFSKSDLLFIFPSITSPESSNNVIREENRLFLNIVDRYRSELSNRSDEFDSGSDSPASFDVTQFVKSVKEMNKGEPIWGRRNKSGVNSSSGELTRLSYGSVVGFGVGELDPENSLSGFMDHVPMGLRRWASYPMILGRIRRSYKHVMLVDVKEVLPLGDSLARVRLGSPDSVYLSSTKHHHKTINPAVITGGARGVRRLSAAMLTEIVRQQTTQTTRNKRKSSVSESVLLSRLAANEYVQKNIHLVDSGELVQEASSLGGVVIAKNNKVVRRGNSNIDIELTKRICSFSIEGSVYTECRKVQPF